LVQIPDQTKSGHKLAQISTDFQKVGAVPSYRRRSI
jgi:hypothetical protein